MREITRGYSARGRPALTFPAPAEEPSILDPRHLVQLAEIIQQGSIARASASLGVPTANLSRNMRALEARLGAPVLEVGRFGARPTKIGNALAEEGRRIRGGLERAEADYRAWRGGMQGRLRLGVGSFIAYALMPRFLADPSVRAWKVAMSVEVSPTEAMLHRVLKGELDVTISHLDPVHVPAGLRIVPLFEERIGFYVAREHSLAVALDVGLERLSREPFLSAGAFFEGAHEAFRSAGAELPLNTLSFQGDVSLVLRVLAQGEHVAALPDFLMSQAPHAESFVRLPVPWTSPVRQAAASLRSESAGAPLVEEFVRRLRSFLRRLTLIQK